MHDPRALFAFEDNSGVVPEYVLQELDNHKGGYEEKNENAREATRMLRSIGQIGVNGGMESQADQPEARKSKKRFNGLRRVPIPGTEGTLIILMDDPKDRVKEEKGDDQILALVHKNRKNFKEPVIIVTIDIVMAIKAMGRGFASQDYKRDRAKTHMVQLPELRLSAEEVTSYFPVELFSGPSMNVQATGILNKTYRKGDKEIAIHPGYYLVSCDTRDMLMHIGHDERVRVIRNAPTMKGGLRAKNAEQMAAIDSLLNEEKTLVCISGPAGTGKTLLAIGAALQIVHEANKNLPQPNGDALSERAPEEMTRNERKQLRKGGPQNAVLGHQVANAPTNGDNRMQILIARPMVSVGRDMGYLPGSAEEKMAPWIAPILDNLKLILGEKQMEAKLQDGTIELQPLQYIHGRSINNAVLIVDEAQNCTPLEIKTIITRAGKRCKMFLTGDSDQIDTPYLDRLSNGLTIAADRMGGEHFTSVIPLTKCERSEMAARAAELL